MTPRKPAHVAPAMVAVIALVASVLVGLGLTPAASAAPTTYSIWSSTTLPTTQAEEDLRSVEVGVKFTTSSDGLIKAIRYFKSKQNTGLHTGSLWSLDGTRLARVDFTRETASGWQQAALTSPVKVKAGSSYVASYRAPFGGYSDDQNSLSQSKPHRTYALTATSGVYTYGESMPTSTWNASNYYVDVVFSSDTITPTPTPSNTPTPTNTKPTSTPSPTPTSSPLAGWPNASNTGVVGCPPLQKVKTGGQVMLTADGETLQNKEFLDPTIVNVRAKNVTIRCVKFNGTGWFGIDNTDRPSSVTVDQVDISCQNKGQVIGMLLRDATVSRANVHDCDHMINAGGDNLTIKDSYCHAMTDLPVVHADCIQSLGGNTNLRIEHNSLWSRDTSDILLGQEGGEAKNVVIHNNRLMSEGNPPPAYLLYLTGTNTVVTDNRFTRRFTYGHCTHNNTLSYTWSGNVWDNDGQPISSC